MRFAIIKDGKVVNVIEAEEGYPTSSECVQSDVANIGNTYSDGTFHEPEVPASTDFKPPTE
jgi:hypothetical protein